MHMRRLLVRLGKDHEQSKASLEDSRPGNEDTNNI
jgi:hypothetical protein